jgi:DNA-binding MarR family transcriptional regulator
MASISDALQLAPTTIHPNLRDLEARGLVIADAPPGEARKRTWVR